MGTLLHEGSEFLHETNERPECMKNTNHKYLCWLAGIKGIGRVKKYALLRAAGEASLFSMLEESRLFSMEEEAGTLSTEEAGHFSLEAAENGRDPGLAARIIYTSSEKELRFLWGEAAAKTGDARKEWQALLNARRQEPDRIEEDMERAGISFISALEKGFPGKLKEIPDPPFGIYYKGSMPFEEEPSAAIIGARLASGYGREQARRFGRRIGARGIAVISGMARGIDGIAQKAALDAGGKSYAVLGCGVDICYPEENRDLYERLQQQGGILSEYPPGMQPIAKLFPPRNRIISGLSDLVLVIEARKRSGTLITVDMALEQGREVYALPGRGSDALSDGCNRLIRQGAGPATCPEDILEFFFGTGSEEERESIKKQDMGRPDENREWEDSHGVVDSEKTSSESLDRRILHLLSLEDEKHIERILEEIRKLDSPGESEKSEDSISLPELVSCLMRLKIDGRVEESSAGYYRKI